jgi:hypothetical protein
MHIFWAHAPIDFQQFMLGTYESQIWGVGGKAA